MRHRASLGRRTFYSVHFCVTSHDHTYDTVPSVQYSLLRLHIHLANRPATTTTTTTTTMVIGAQGPPNRRRWYWFENPHDRLAREQWERDTHPSLSHEDNIRAAFDVLSVQERLRSTPRSAFLTDKDAKFYVLLSIIAGFVLLVGYFGMRGTTVVPYWWASTLLGFATVGVLLVTRLSDPGVLPPSDHPDEVVALLMLRSLSLPRTQRADPETSREPSHSTSTSSRVPGSTFASVATLRAAAAQATDSSWVQLPVVVGPYEYRQETLGTLAHVVQPTLMHAWLRRRVDHRPARPRPPGLVRYLEEEEAEGGDESSVSISGWRKYCHTCNIWRTPRAHHCRKCGFCIRRFDHHCTYYGVCVGQYNMRWYLWGPMLGAVACAFGAVGAWLRAVRALGLRWDFPAVYRDWASQCLQHQHVRGRTEVPCWDLPLTLLAFLYAVGVGTVLVFVWSYMGYDQWVTNNTMKTHRILTQPVPFRRGWDWRGHVRHVWLEVPLRWQPRDYQEAQALHRDSPYRCIATRSDGDEDPVLGGGIEEEVELGQRHEEDSMLLHRR